MLVAGQVLIGMGCAPAFLVCTVFIARHFPTGRFAAVSGLTLGLGGLGMLLTGTPLAWLIEATSWRMGFWVLAALAALAWLLIFILVHEPAHTRAAQGVRARGLRQIRRAAHAAAHLGHPDHVGRHLCVLHLAARPLAGAAADAAP
jgi:MFS family permease